jgi:predicted kinase
MNPIFVVVGPPAVGKSTTSRALAARFPKSIHIPVDDLRHMVVSGVVLPSPVWSDALTQQISLARASVLHMALAYHHAGFAVVIDDFLDPHDPAAYHVLRRHPHAHKIVLYPAQQTAHQRNLQRAGVSAEHAYIDDGIGVIYQHLHGVVDQLAQDGWRVVDTTHLSVEATVSTILHA